MTEEKLSYSIFFLQYTFWLVIVQKLQKSLLTLMMTQLHCIVPVGYDSVGVSLDAQAHQDPETKAYICNLRPIHFTIFIGASVKK